MDIFEYSEAHWPTRVLQQEEEEQAEATAAANLQEPEVTWTAGAPLEDGALEVELLVVATTAAACALLDACLPSAAQVGSIVPVPGAPGAAPGSDLDVIYGGAVSARPRRRASTIAALPGGAAAAACCREDVAPERAGAWARALLRAVRAARVLVLGSMSAEHYRGGGDPSQEFLSFVLSTSAAATAAAAAPRQQQQAKAAAAALPPRLASGSIVAGLPAALLSACEVAGVPAQLLVSVDQVVALLPDSLPHLAAGAAALLDQRPAGAGAGSVAAALRDRARVAAARDSLEHGAAAARTGSVYA
ncbi:hypothetical protein Rsub_05226 [Raphidocelis subcapitata]|uniref:Proteasome assembly chaperone 1 n=1 Tax=Raphidocelis subcapitata TaxID=307507 RepID=A0A2V0P114_9CHLO|nr:hypothetical protein Rsub_05226 [Raphidocelis subcapitata]|eukprot:GBF92612.1 hypothetical protein Rsub_05226 [Raphidocelis subcapitata]